MQIPFDWRWLSLPPTLVAIYYIARGVHRLMYKITLMVTFIEEMRDNHLPHIYSRLTNIERGLGIGDHK